MQQILITTESMPVSVTERMLMQRWKGQSHDVVVI